MSDLRLADNSCQSVYGVWKEYPAQIPCVEQYYLVTVDCDYGEFMMDIVVWFCGKWYGLTGKECTDKVQAFCELPNAYLKDE